MLDKLSNVLNSPTEELGKISRFLVLQVRIWFHFGRLFIGVNRCLTQAAALAYHSIFGLVPLVIVTLMVFQMFPAFQGISEKVKELAYENTFLAEMVYPSETGEMIQVSNELDTLAEGFISKAHTGASTVVGLGLVIWAAIALLTTIEKTFNHIYHVTVGRAFLHRLFNYWALLTLGPILLALGIYVGTQVMKNKIVQKYALLQQQVAEEDSTVTPIPADPNAPVTSVDQTQLGGGDQFKIHFTASVVPFLISIIGFFFLYFFLPNTRVSPGSALWGSFVASLIWMLAKWGFGMYVTKFVPQFAIYGVLGIIPLTVMWIYVSWLIVLFGLQLTYATQHVKKLDAAEFSKMRKQDQCFLANNQTVIRVMEYVLNAFEQKDQKPVSVEAVAYRLGMPTDFTEKILERMVQSNLLCRTDDPAVGYVPSTDGSHITLDEISRAIGEISFAQVDKDRTVKMQEVFAEQEKLFSRYTLKEILNRSENFELQQDLMEETEQPVNTEDENL